MHEFTLKSREEDWFTLNIGERSYKIPLMTCIPYDTVKKAMTMDGFIEFIKQHIDAETADTLTLLEYGEIAKMWSDFSKETAKEKGIELGESQASRRS